MKFKDIEDTIFTDDPYYDLIEGGYIKPEELLEDPKEAEAVRAAVNLLEQFFKEAKRKGIIELC